MESMVIEEGTILSQELLEKWGEKSQIESIILSCLNLASSLQKYKKMDKTEYPNYTNSYNDVCNKIGEMKVMLDQCEFIFNIDEINKHRDLFIEHLKEEINQY